MTIGKILRTGIVTVIMAVATSCSTGERPDAAKVKVEIGRLERDIYAGVRPDSSFNDAMLGWGEIIGLALADDSVYAAYSASAPVRVFTPDVESVFGDTDGLADRLGVFEYNMSQIFSDKHPRKYFTVVSPYRQSVYIYADSIVYIALNHYLGADYEGYAGRFAEYEKAGKTALRIPADVARAVVSSLYPYNGGESGGSVVSRMLYEGAVADIMMRLMPDASAASVMGYTDADYEWLQENESEAWRALVGKDILYSTSSADAARLFSPSAFTGIIHRDAPGAAGRYFGYRMVEKYLASNRDAEAEYLLSPAFYADDRTFARVGYTGM